MANPRHPRGEGERYPGGYEDLRGMDYACPALARFVPQSDSPSLRPAAVNGMRLAYGIGWHGVCIHPRRSSSFTLASDVHGAQDQGQVSRC